jgi:carbon-monoxide dehydrogenase medium subunit
VALDARIVLASTRGLRRVKAVDFFLELYTTAMSADEIIVACEFPLMTATTRCAFDELARRQGDYAIVGLAAVAQVEQQTLNQLRLVFLGTGNIPTRVRNTEAVLEGKVLTAETLAAAKTALAGELAPAADLYNSAAMKLHLATVMLGRLLARLSA